MCNVERLIKQALGTAQAIDTNIVELAYDGVGYQMMSQASDAWAYIHDKNYDFNIQVDIWLNYCEHLLNDFATQREY
jgi:hypothetical protein